MEVSLAYFWGRMLESPMLFVAVALTVSVVFVNGWTDAPNAIATCVSTRSMGVNAAIFMSAAFNFAGALTMSMWNANVAMTIRNMVNFGGRGDLALIALAAALTAIVIWAVSAWAFGIPTSESHALIAGLSGAAIALNGGLSGINGSEWVKVLYGLVLSSVAGFGAGYGVAWAVSRLFRNLDRRSMNRFFGRAQIFGGAAMSFMHGA